MTGETRACTRKTSAPKLVETALYGRPRTSIWVRKCAAEEEAKSAAAEHMLKAAQASAFVQEEHEINNHYDVKKRNT